jgi:hypothetical protein
MLKQAKAKGYKMSDVWPQESELHVVAAPNQSLENSAKMK